MKTGRQFLRRISQGRRSRTVLVATAVFAAVATAAFATGFGVTVSKFSTYDSGASAPKVTTSTSSVTAPATGTVGSAIAGSSISVTLSGGTNSPSATGTISFTVFGPGSAPTDCSPGLAAASLGSATVTGTGNNGGGATYSASGSFTPNAAGTYWWYAAYSGDSLNSSSNSGCGSGMTSTSVAAAPAVTLSASSGNVGDQVSISGSNFPASTALSATFAGASVTLTGTTSTDASGSFSGAKFNVPTVTAGSKTVTVTAGTKNASATFTVNPKVALSPATGGVGCQAVVIGTGFAANSAISGTFGGSAVTTLSGGPTDANGSFTAAFVVPSSSSGAKTVTISDSATPANSASATYTVALSSTLCFSALGSAQTWTSSGSKSVSYPSGTNQNDLLFLVLMNTNNGTTPTAPTGWTQLATVNQNTGTKWQFTVWWKLAGSPASDSSVALTVNPGTGSAGATAWVARYVRPAGYPPNPSSAATAASGTGANATSLTPTSSATSAANATVISIVGISSTQSLSLSAAQGFGLEVPPSGSNAPASGVSFAIGFADRVVTTSGTTPTMPTWAVSSTTRWTYATVAFS